MKKILILLLATSCYAGGPNYGPNYNSQNTNQEFQQVYHDLQYPQISTGTAQNFTVAKKLTVPNGVAATDAAAFGQIPTSTDWASYTPTLGGAGTTTNVSFFWRQIGNTIFVKGYFTTGTLTATTASISLPNGTVINTTHATANFTLGNYNRLYSGASSQLAMGQVFTDGSTTDKVFYTPNAGSGAYTKFGTSSIMGNGDSVSVSFDYPI